MDRRFSYHPTHDLFVPSPAVIKKIYFIILTLATWKINRYKFEFYTWRKQTKINIISMVDVKHIKAWDEGDLNQVVNEVWIMVPRLLSACSYYNVSK